MLLFFRYFRKNRQKELRYLDIPFLQDEETIKHAKISHFMFIMRGVSGSGKSTIVSELKSTYSDAVVCSADDFFFGENGVYTFDIKLLPVAHESCRNKARTACETKKNIVIIDNTNVKKWEMTDYVNMASNHGYVINIIVPQTPWCFDPVELARKNQHGVPEEVLCKKIKMFEEVMPIYYGWILNQSDSISLTKTVSSYFSYCVDNLSEFKEVMKDKIRLGGKIICIRHRLEGEMSSSQRKSPHQARAFGRVLDVVTRAKIGPSRLAQ